jgi:hypothetical protein
MKFHAVGFKSLKKVIQAMNSGLAFLYSLRTMNGMKSKGNKIAHLQTAF